MDKPTILIFYSLLKKFFHKEQNFKNAESIVNVGLSTFLLFFIILLDLPTSSTSPQFIDQIQMYQFIEFTLLYF